MKSIKRSVFSILLLGLMVVPVFSQSHSEGLLGSDFSYEELRNSGIDLQLGGHFHDPGGTILLDNDLGDSEANFENDLDINRNVDPQAELKAQPLAGHHFILGFSKMEYEERNTLSRSITVKGDSYSSGDEVDSDIRMDTWEFQYRYDFLRGHEVTLSPTIGADLMKLDADIDNITSGDEGTINEDAPIPKLGFRAEVYPWDRWGFYGEVDGVAIDVSDVDGSMFNWEVGSRFHFSRHVSIIGGYQEKDFDFNVNDTEVDSNIDRLFVNFGFQF